MGALPHPPGSCMSTGGVATQQGAEVESAGHGCKAQLMPAHGSQCMPAWGEIAWADVKKVEIKSFGKCRAALELRGRRENAMVSLWKCLLTEAKMCNVSIRGWHTMYQWQSPLVHAPAGCRAAYQSVSWILAAPAAWPLGRELMKCAAVWPNDPSLCSLALAAPSCCRYLARCGRCRSG